MLQSLAGEPIDVPSPTFTLVQHYHLGGRDIWHVDLYRLNDADEALELGLEDGFASGITLIEWPERIEELLPGDRLDILLEQTSGEARTALLHGGPSWRERLERLFDD